MISQKIAVVEDLWSKTLWTEKNVNGCGTLNMCFLGVLKTWLIAVMEVESSSVMG